jgi:hypothetical protein
MRLPEFGYRPASLSGRIRAAAQRWLLGYGELRLKRQLSEYEDPPELRKGPWIGRRLRSDQPHVFRSFLQVNFYPRQRP